MTGLELKELFIENEHVDNFTDSVFLERVRLINRLSYKVEYRNTQNFVELSEFIKLDGDKSVYSIVDDFLVSDFLNIDVSLAGVYDEYGEKLQETGVMDRDKGFYIKKGNVYFTGDYEDSQKKVQLVYVPVGKTIDDINSELNIDDEYKLWAVSMMKTLYDIYDDRTGDEVVMSQMIEDSFKNEYLKDNERSKKVTGLRFNLR